ncbi:metalloregulator ArsR/SmtB family transcription factor [soil metagenome]|jgi:ArsR family transcriptional regulator
MAPTAEAHEGNAERDLCETQCVDEVTVRRAQKVMKPPHTLATLAETFKVLGDPTRISIAWALSREELCVCDLAALLGMSQSAVSHSLRALRQLRLVRYRREGKVAFYTLDDDHIAHLLEEGVRHVEEAR